MFDEKFNYYEGILKINNKACKSNALPFKRFCFFFSSRHAIRRHLCLRKIARHFLRAKTQCLPSTADWGMSLLFTFAFVADWFGACRRRRWKCLPPVARLIRSPPSGNAAADTHQNNTHQLADVKVALLSPEPRVCTGRRNCPTHTLKSRANLRRRQRTNDRALALAIFKPSPALTNTATAEPCPSVHHRC